MKFQIDESGQQVSLSEIAAFEAGAQVKLPPQYKAFLLNFNGGQPTEMVFPNSGFDADVQVFYSLFRYPLSTSRNGSVVKCSEDLVWFGIDSGGGEFAIAHTGKNFGKVFWFDSPHSDINSPSSTDCELVATSFDHFLDSLEAQS